MAGERSPQVMVDAVEKVACSSCGAVVDVSQVKPLTLTTCPSCKNTFLVPGRIGQFMLLKCLGRGGMGSTYKSKDKVLKRQVAVKIMHPVLGKDQQMVESFFNEARALACLNHPSVAQIYSLGQEKGQPFIVMELIAGNRLDQLFTREQPMGEARALDLAIDICEGLMAVSRINMIHGDIKPGNILLSEQGIPKLVDFGMARLAHRESSDDVGLGTPYYVSPEQVRGEPLTFASDIYSLGATLSQMLTGRPPFEGDDPQAVREARLRTPAPDVRQLQPHLLPQTACIVAKMLQRDPAERYQNYQDLAGDLYAAHKAAGQRDVQEYMAAQQPAQPVPPPSIKPTVGRRRVAPIAPVKKNSWILPFAIAGVLAAIVGVLLVIMCLS